jgi:osmoprotectant transport system ATP-binding protein
VAPKRTSGPLAATAGIRVGSWSGAVIRFESVTKRYPDGTVAVDGLDLVAETGQITIFVGPSGCGKTTSLRMINRLIEPTSGRIWLDDQDTATIDSNRLRRGIGYVIQHGGLFPHRTVTDNIVTVPVLLGESRRQARRKAYELLERVGLPPALGSRYPAQLSGGQQQRVGVARALAADPPVMLMDEPFSAVDPVVRAQLQDEFLRLQGELRKTIVFVTHDIDEAVKLGDRVAVLSVGGRLAQLATPRELLAKPANSFVAEFVGRDRGYRALGFTAAGVLPYRDETVVVLGEPLETVRDRASDGWVLVVDSQQRPLGWLSIATAEAAAAGPVRDGTAGNVSEGLLNLGGTLATEDSSLRAALDAALSSPSRRGVVVRADGTVVGTVSASQVLDRIEAERAVASPAVETR